MIIASWGRNYWEFDQMQFGKEFFFYDEVCKSFFRFDQVEP